MEVPLNEIGISKSKHIKTDTFKLPVFVDLEIINKHSQYFKNTFNIALVEVSKCLPSIYRQFKFHKNPARFRYISSDNKCRFLTGTNTS